MEPFVHLEGPAAPLLEDNVDTDVIYPARFLLITAREGLGKYAFHDRRFDAEDAERADFVLNQAPFRDATILIAGANFGCGSSREQAVWTLLGRSIRCVIAPSFGEIFHANCLRNGVLPITLDVALVRNLAAIAQHGTPFAVDLETCTLRAAGSDPITFAIPGEARRGLINGWDETALIVNQHSASIAAFEERQRTAQPWLFTGAP